MPHAPELSPAASASHEGVSLARRPLVWLAHMCALMQRYPRATFWLTLALITAVGAFFRFWRIDFQTYWTDDAHTINRICGDFERMMQKLDNQGFPPGWYVLLRWWAGFQEWRLGSGAAAFAPESLRLLPAFFGVLTIPAMYFLARQFTDRRGALLVALLAAVNPFFIYYSRDIKMYAALWCFATLNMAIFFHWLTNTRQWLWLPLLALTGCALTALHGGAWFLVALQLIFVLTRPRPRPFDVPLWSCCVFLMSLLPVWWYAHKTNWITRVVEENSQGGLQWVHEYTDMNAKTIASLPTAHVLGYLWPEQPASSQTLGWFGLGNDFNEHLSTRAWTWLTNVEFVAMFALFAVLVLGLFPWRGRRPTAESDAAATRRRWWWIGLWIALPTICLAITWLEPGSPWYKALWWWKKTPPPEIWEPRYLGIVVPAFLLWTAAAVRRLPLAPVRVGVAAGLVVACALSALSNHLIHRNAPYAPVAKMIMRYYDREHPESIALATPAIRFMRPWQDAFTYEIAAGIRPWSPEDMQGDFVLGGSPRDRQTPYWFYRQRGRNTGDFDLAIFDEFRDDADVKTIIMADRLGDLPDTLTSDKGLTRPNPLSNESIARKLGPKWKLDCEDSVEWHYEWRFNIFHTWRIRAWVRMPAAPPKASPS